MQRHTGKRTVQSGVITGTAALKITGIREDVSLKEMQDHVLLLAPILEKKGGRSSI
jgi:hypothetical protein